MNLYPATAFIRHLLTARSAAGHGVHSPFVFDFLTTVVRGKSDTQIIREVESLRREMLNDRRVVRVTDLGAGSAVHKGQERRISEIASTAALPARYVALLSRIARATQQIPHHRVNPGIQSDEAYSQLDSGESQATLPGRPGSGSPGIILELGTSLGISTLALALAAPERRVVTVEGCPKLAEIARENLRRHGAANAEILNMDFSAALNLLRSEGANISLAFIDGNHKGEALKKYVSEISTLGDEMVIVADDIHLNRDMYNSWRSLADPSLQAPASRKAPSRAEKIPRVYTGTAPAAAEKTAPVHPATAPAAAEKTPPVHTGTAPATAEKIPPVHHGPAPATMETFRFGILFCLKSLTPRHYRIRY